MIDSGRDFDLPFEDEYFCQRPQTNKTQHNPKKTLKTCFGTTNEHTIFDVMDWSIDWENSPEIDKEMPEEDDYSEESDAEIFSQGRFIVLNHLPIRH